MRGAHGEIAWARSEIGSGWHGDKVAEMVSNAKDGDVIMLENTRFYKEETKNEPSFGEKLADPFDLYVNDVFGNAHLFHARAPPRVDIFTVDNAKGVMTKTEKLGKTIFLPSDIVVTDAFSADANTQTVDVESIPDGWLGLDNGPKTTEEQKEALPKCNTVIMKK